MQEERQFISPIKQRILHYAATLGISKREFYAKIGVSRGTLESKTGITEDVLAKFIAVYKDVSPTWLLTGEGDMLKKNLAADIAINTDVRNVEGYVAGQNLTITDESEYGKIIREDSIEFARQDKVGQEVQRLAIENESLRRELLSKDNIIDSLIKALGGKISAN